MRKDSTLLLTLTLCLTTTFMAAQDYTDWFTGDSTDVISAPDFGICMMGGAVENDSAMVWFLEKANHGDVVVIRASGSDGYNDYMYSQLGVDINSVETIRFNTAEAASDPYVLQQLNDAEAIWIAGGDQNDYVEFWKGNGVEDALNNLINEREGAVGGTSAGMAILGGTYFSAALGTITSEDALSDPTQAQIALGYEDFLDVPYMEHVITDTHYDDGVDTALVRSGRHFAFLSNLRAVHDVRPFGIAAEEYCALCFDESGIAHAYGEYPDYEDYVYFLQANCNYPGGPEVFEEGQPLTWNRDNEAVVVYKLPATPEGSYGFDLNTWESGSGGQWQYWYTQDGELMTTQEVNPEFCESSIGNHPGLGEYLVYPNPALNRLTVDAEKNLSQITVYDVAGKEVLRKDFSNNSSQRVEVDISALCAGIYMVRLDGLAAEKVLKR